VFFSMVLPVIPVLAFLYNIILICCSASRNSFVDKRLIAKGSYGIGIWNNAIEVISFFGIAISFSMVYWTSNI